MSRSFLWELEKLRREFGVDTDEVKAAAKELGRKRRGPPGYDDDRRLASMRDGASAQTVAASEGVSTADATRIRIGRKKRKQSLIAQYWEKIEELTDVLVKLPPPLCELYTEQIKAAGPPAAPHLIMVDLAICNMQRVLDGNRLSPDDRDHIERGRFRANMVRDIDLDSPVRRERLSDRIRKLEAILRELRSKIT